MIAAVLLAAAAGTPVIPRSLSALCPPPAPGEIVVCADRDPAGSPYRLPLPSARVAGARGTASVSRERNALIAPDNASLGSCSAVGPGGWTGCSYQEFKRNVEQAAGGRDPRGRIFSPH